MKDAFGRELQAGDLVVHVSRYGSTMSTTPYRLHDVGPRSCRVLRKNGTLATFTASGGVVRLDAEGLEL